MKISELLRQRPTLSFEIFPPKNKDGDISSIYSTIDQLAQLKPDFISVTYGAGGSTTRNTVEIATMIKERWQIESVAHLSCIDATAENLRGVLDQLKEKGIENILALRGDYPKGYDPQTAPQEFRHASDLAAFITANYPDAFCLSGACYPEVHEEADSLEADLRHLKIKAHPIWSRRSFWTIIIITGCCGRRANEASKCRSWRASCRRQTRSSC